ncbi:hypothetical protein HHK36_022836 [Tetracentron sinense]|uniref:Uncharacterized protein n=1 Tax=Tetracentron sinense TaxID=13715 RepID=A0A835DA03_TETSI|nr:hypothetical protein HHK36_022836 [Tetracentron sinense]
MAHSSRHGFCNPGFLRLVLVLVSVCLVGYIVGPPLYWHLRENLTVEASCPPCVCDCSSEAIFSIPLGLLNSSFADCGKHDPDMSEEMEKDIVNLLSEELNLQRNVTNDNLEHTKAAILDMKKTSSQYQKEAEKCNSGMETCEEAREKAEAALVAECKLSALWEKRAREQGWKDRRRA